MNAPPDRRSILDLGPSLTPNSALCVRSRRTELEAPERPVGTFISISLLSEAQRRG